MNQQKNELQTLEDIFDNGNRIFRIPDYQRGYSWEEQQRKDLLTDIEYLIKSGYEYRHYTGTIVASSTGEEKNSFKVFDVVDGQQRMTSLVLLLSVICRLSKETTGEIFTKFIKDDPAYKLELGKEQNDLFKQLLTEGVTAATVVKSKSDQNLLDAVRGFQEWLKELKKDKIYEVLDCVCGKLGFLLYVPKIDKELGIMFEVINNRGKALTELEKIKNYLIYYADKNDKTEIKMEVKAAWPDILSNLNKIGYTSNESEDSFLRNCWIVFMETHKSRSYHVYDGLKQKWAPDKEQHTPEILRFIKFLKDASTFYVKYLKQEGVTDRQEERWLKWISCHPADASITPLILAIFKKVGDLNDRITLFELLEKLNFRFYGTGIAGRTDSGQGELFYYANAFFNDEQDKDGKIINVKWLKNKLTGFIAHNANDKKFVEYLTLDKDEAGNYYTWVGLKFFLSSYEEELRKRRKESTDIKKMMAPRDRETPNDFFHREHIWAEKDYTKINDSGDLNVNKRRLGNFLLLKETENIKVSNKPPEEKVKLYFEDRENDPNTLMIRELEDIFDKAKEKEEKERDWKRKTSGYWYRVYQRFLDKREERMINFALERWRVSTLGSKILKVELDSLADDNKDNKIYTCTYAN